MPHTRAASLVAALVAILLVAGHGSGASAGTPADDPSYSVPVAVLDDALDCDEFTHPDKEPVLLVHGTFTSGHEQWDWNYALLLRETGHDVCIVTYPDRGLGDMQVSAEYVARAVQTIRTESGRKVDMVGHSQGALMPRWAIKWWPSVRAALDDFVLLAGPAHGTSVASGTLPTGQPAAFFQFSPDSAFIRTLNDGDETPGAIDYSSIYTRYDELVQPVEPPTAALDPGIASPMVANILLQDLCPLNVSDHLTIGTVDRQTQLLTLDALDNAGPTDPSRAGIDALTCALEGLYVVPDSFPAIVAQFESSAASGLPDVELVTEEPPLRDYAVPPAAPGPSSGPAIPDGMTDDVDAPNAVSTPPTGIGESSAGTRPLAATGRAIPILAAGIAIGVALLLRLGMSRLDDADSATDRTSGGDASDRSRR